MKLYANGVVATEGLIAHGRGEAFDYLIGEHTIPPAAVATKAAAAAILLAKHSVISVNGNTAALAGAEVVKLAGVSGSKIEVNLFYDREKRQAHVKRLLETLGADDIYGCDARYQAEIKELTSSRRKVDRRGILTADVILLSLEDGDRTEALRNLGKKVIAIDLNPLSRTAKAANIAICDNVVRAIPNLARQMQRLKRADKGSLRDIVDHFDNPRNLKETMQVIYENLRSPPLSDGNIR